MSCFDLKKTWGLGHIEMKQTPYCNISTDVVISVRPAVYGCYFDGTIFRRRYLGHDIENVFLNVMTAKQAILYWYGLNGLTHLENDN